MDAPRLRPTFTVPLAMTREQAIERIRDAFVARDELQGRWRGKGRWAEIHVPAHERKIWSPHLSLRIDHEKDGCTLFGRYAPDPEVWTFFMFVYFGVAFLVVLGGIFGYVQWASNEAPWGLWAVWIGLPIIILLHLASWTGQRLGQDQMRSLRATLDEVLVDLEG